VGLDSMNSEINQIVYYNFLNTESSYPYFTRERKLTPPIEIVRRKERDDSIKIAKATERSQIELKASVTGSQSVDSLIQKSLTEPFDSVITMDRELVFKKDSIPDLSNPTSDLVTDRPILNKEYSQKVDTFVSRKTIKRKPIKGNQSNSRTDSIISKIEIDSLGSPELVLNNTVEAKKKFVFTPEKRAAFDSVILKGDFNTKAATVGMNNARTIKNNFSTKLTQIDALEREFRRFEIAWYQKYTTAFACIVMFMIGAPLGAIIKKGGLGMPVLLSIIFFILFYMLTITGEKWAKEGVTNSLFGTWFSNLVLLPFGFFFLRQARKDARLFEPDTYIEFFKKIKAKFQVKSSKSLP
jgi:lipopolysaccharide export system permease protein